MAREWLTDEQVVLEIARLKESEFVKLARKEQRIRMKQRQALYNLRALEKKGKALAAAGITLELLDEIDSMDELEALEL